MSWKSGGSASSRTPRRCEMQRALVEDRRAGRVPDLLLLLEHPHVITLGAKLDAAAIASGRHAAAARASVTSKCTKRAAAATSPITGRDRSSAIPSWTCGPIAAMCINMCAISRRS